jgi:hypothetical protein
VDATAVLHISSVTALLLMSVRFEVVRLKTTQRPTGIYTPSSSPRKNSPR